jgi:hypothetical protein
MKTFSGSHAPVANRNRRPPRFQDMVTKAIFVLGWFYLGFLIWTGLRLFGFLS